MKQCDVARVGSLAVSLCGHLGIRPMIAPIHPPPRIPPAAAGQLPKLLNRVRAVLRLRQDGLRTQAAYVAWSSKHSLFFLRIARRLQILLRAPRELVQEFHAAPCALSRPCWPILSPTALRRTDRFVDHNYDCEGLPRRLRRVLFEAALEFLRSHIGA
jgi:hypothetical protein